MNIVLNGLAELGNVVEANVSEFSLLGNKKYFCLKYKNIFASWTQILHPKHMFYQHVASSASADG